MGGWPTLTISAYTVHAEGAPSLRLLQGWAALLRALFGFAADTRPNPRGVAISGSRRLGDAREIKTLGHPPLRILPS